jgi:tetratricopeptide (TPR) repeat protein
MKATKFILLLITIGFFSCKSNSTKHEIEAEVGKFTYKIIPLVKYLNNADSCKKALLFLDSATNIDSNCIQCYYEKLMFLNSLQQYDKAIIAINNTIRINPKAPDLYLTGGLFYEKIKDTISSKKYFQKSLQICDAVLDTMNSTNKNYLMLASNKAVVLIMLEQQTKADELLKQLANSETDEVIKKNILLMIGKKKEDLIEQMTSAQRTDK